ncbi:MAG TPA: hypothetical protein VHD31_01235 [Candidatus Paceibacterota bacterium]|nr:hypothetical protein [Candidatus Paceibacterota bacterium]
MDSIHFLNIEYLLLRVYDFFWTVPGVSSTVGEAQAPASQALAWIGSFAGQVAIVGMTLSVILLALLVWARIRLITVEHHGYHEKEAHEHEHAHEEPEPPKNAQWERVHTLANSPNESDWRRAILEADIMLGDMLTQLGYRGKEVGEKLRDANPLQFTTLDLAWKAHKVRNDIAHGGESFQLTSRDANATIDLYRRVFEEFSYI